jgi:hypothetical protein
MVSDQSGDTPSRDTPLDHLVFSQTGVVGNLREERARICRNSKPLVMSR